jgi:hypothetical protein
MKRWTGSVIIMLSIVVGRPHAQQAPAGNAELTVIPASWTYFGNSTAKSQPSFARYDLGIAMGFRANRLVGVEAEVGVSLGMKQVGRMALEETTPDMFSYTWNAVVQPRGHAVVPYATAGIGGLTISRKEYSLANNADTVLTGNVGGGIKWFESNHRWGIRADYRLQMLRSGRDAAEFFGRGTRYGHRVYGGIILKTAH